MKAYGIGWCVVGGQQYLWDSAALSMVKLDGKNITCPMCGRVLKWRYGPMGVQHMMVPRHKEAA